MIPPVARLIRAALDGERLGEPLAWAGFLPALAQSRAGPWLYRSGHGASPRLAAALRHEAAQAAALRLGDDRVREEVLGALAAAGLSPVVLKGSVLGPWLYGEAYLRPAFDLDVLLADPAERREAARVLASLGFRPEARGPESHEAAFARPGDLLVEVHRHLTQPGRYAVPLAELEARAVPWGFRGLALRRLGDEDLLAHWVVHAAHHKFRLPAVQWLDVVLLVRRGVDLAAVAARCKRWGCGAAWGLAAETAAAWFGVDELRAHAPGPGLRAAILRRLPAGAGDPFAARPLAAAALVDAVDWAFASRYAGARLGQRLRQLRSRSR